MFLEDEGPRRPVVNSFPFRILGRKIAKPQGIVGELRAQGSYPQDYD